MTSKKVLIIKMIFEGASLWIQFVLKSKLVKKLGQQVNFFNDFFIVIFAVVVGLHVVLLKWRIRSSLQPESFFLLSLTAGYGPSSEKRRTCSLDKKSPK